MTDVALDPPLIRMRDLQRDYTTPAGTTRALAGLDLDVQRAEFVAVVGASGSGKSTLLNLLGGLDRPTGGSLLVEGRDLSRMSESDLTRWRAAHVGFVFQFFQLLPTLTVLENVLLPMDFAQRWPRPERVARGRALLDRLGVGALEARLPATLSGGQQQRVAVARALANAPGLILADEPTGNLDSANAAVLLALLGELVADGHTVVLVTHERDALPGVTRIVRLADGRLQRDPAPSTNP
jgi:ABC-type lipoprotein export system ATPase subunit